MVPAQKITKKNLIISVDITIINVVAVKYVLAFIYYFYSIDI